MNWVLGVVDGVDLHAEGSAGHHVQTERCNQSERGKNKKPKGRGLHVYLK